MIDSHNATEIIPCLLDYYFRLLYVLLLLFRGLVVPTCLTALFTHTAHSAFYSFNSRRSLLLDSGTMRIIRKCREKEAAAFDKCFSSSAINVTYINPFLFFSIVVAVMVITMFYFDH